MRQMKSNGLHKILQREKYENPEKAEKSEGIGEIIFGLFTLSLKELVGFWKGRRQEVL